MKLNVGSSVPRGRYKTDPDWVNFDLVKLKRINVVGDMVHLPFRDNSFDEIHCIHVLEHLTREKQAPVIKELKRVSKPGCPVYIEVPDFEKVCKLFLEELEKGNLEQARIWTVSVYGKSERKGMAHHWGFTKQFLSKLLQSCGFTTVEFPTEMISNHYKQEPVILSKSHE